MRYYATHYFDFSEAGSFFLVAFLGLVSIIAIILVAARIQTKYHGKKDVVSMNTSQIRLVRNVHHSLLESFYEMVFSSTSVLIFLSLYYILDAYASPISDVWYQYQDILLLIFIVFSTILTSWFDVAFVKLKHISSDQKAIIRLLSAFYIILILIYIKFVYKDDNYDQLIIYFLLLAAGRFLYFDTTLKWLGEILTELGRNIPLLVLMSLYSAIVCYYGFKSGFLLTSNGVIVSTLIAHLFMDAAIFILARTGIIRFFLPDEHDLTRRNIRKQSVGHQRAADYQRYEARQYDDPRYTDSRYADPRYDNSQYDDRWDDDREYDDWQYEDSRYDDREYDDPQYDDREYNDSRYDNRRR